MCLWDSGTQFARRGALGIRPMRHHIKGAQAHGEIDVISFCPDTAHNLAQDARSVFETAAVPSVTGVRPEKFVQQITVTMLDVHEVRPRLTRNPRRPHVIGD